MLGPDPFLPGFDRYDVEAGAVRIRASVGGEGPPGPLRHGRPPTHAIWQASAPILAECFRVVALDLRVDRDPATRHAICEDSRAAATIDLEHDAADADRRLEVPLWALRGAKGTVGQTYDVLATWREKALAVQGDALDWGTPRRKSARILCALLERPSLPMREYQVSVRLPHRSGSLRLGAIGAGPLCDPTSAVHPARGRSLPVARVCS